MRERFYLIVILTFLCINTYAQEIDLELFTTEDGMASLSTKAICKDQRGFLWIGTDYGLQKYDGYSFTLVTLEEDDFFKNSNIEHIEVDEANNLWIFHANHNLSAHAIYSFRIFNPLTEKIISAEDYFEDPLPFDVSALYRTKVSDPENRIWITDREGSIFLYEKRKFRKVFEQKGSLYRNLVIGENDNIFLSTKNKILQIDLSGQLLKTFTLSHPIFGIWTDENNTIWTASCETKDSTVETSLWIKTTADEDFKAFSLREESIESRTQSDLYIYRMRNGCWVLNVKGTLSIYNEQKNLKVLLEGEEKFNIQFMKHLAFGNQVWFTTQIGLLKGNIKADHFQIIHQTKGLSDSRGITAGDDGFIYFLCSSSTYRWQSSNNKLELLRDRDGGFNLAFADSALIIGTYSNKILATELAINSKEQIDYPILRAPILYCFLKTNSPEKFLIGTKTGLEYINIKTKEILPFEEILGSETEYNILRGSPVAYIHQNKSGIWLATEKGLFFIPREQDRIILFNKESGQIPFNNLRHIYEDEDGIFWLSTRGEGVIRWQPPLENRPSSYKQFTTKNGLTNDYIYAIYEDEYHQLWMSSDEGLICFDRIDHQIIRNFTTEDGLPHNEFNAFSHYQAADGTLYFGGLGGVLSFHPKDYYEESPQGEFSCAFTKVQTLEEDREEMTDKLQDVLNSNSISLSPSDKMLELEFVFLDFEDIGEHQYAYKIEGYQNKWTYLNGNDLRITSLPYGEYTLRIKGKNRRAGGHSERELKLAIHVLKPFYLQSWFIGLCILSLGGMIFYYVKRSTRKLERDRVRLESEVRRRTQTILEQSHKLEELDKAKTRFFANITHEFRTPLTLILGPTKQTIVDPNTPKKLQKRMTGVLKNANYLLDLINQLLDLSKIESGKMNVEFNHGDIVAYTHDLSNRFQPLAQHKELLLSFQSDLKKWDTHFDKEKWNKIVFNLLNNAIKFTNAKGQISVKLFKIGGNQKEAIGLEVSDSGIGMSEKEVANIFSRFYQADDSSTRLKGGTGIGLALVKELVELQDGEVEVSSEKGKGSTFFIRIPLLKDIPETTSLEILDSLEVLVPQVILPLKVNDKKTITGDRDKLLILVVEDNEDMRQFIKECIDDHSSYTILQAANGEEGIKMALEHIPDLIISDVMMPVKDGFELTKTIRGNIATSHIPLILLTAKTALESRIEGLKRGADAYLTKPFSPEELSVRVNKLIEFRELMHQRYQQSTEELEPNILLEKEDDFVNQIRIFILGNIEKTNLNGDVIGRHVGISRVHLYRKLKALTNKTISEFVKEVRLEKAMEFIKEGKLNVSEISYQTGFSSISQFSKIFKKTFGKPPSEMIR